MSIVIPSGISEKVESIRGLIIERVKAVLKEHDPVLASTFELLELIDEIAYEQRLEPNVKTVPIESIIGRAEQRDGFAASDMKEQQRVGTFRCLKCKVEALASDSSNHFDVGLCAACFNVDLHSCSVCGMEFRSMEPGDPPTCSGTCEEEAKVRIKRHEEFMESPVPSAIERNGEDDLREFKGVGAITPIRLLTAPADEADELEKEWETRIPTEESGALSVQEIIAGCSVKLGPSYETERLISLVRELIANPDLGGAACQTILMLSSIQATGLPLRWARYHAEQIKGLPDGASKRAYFEALRNGRG